MKYVLPIFISLVIFALSSFGGTCGTCSDQSLVTFYTGEFCKGNIAEDLVYSSAKNECETVGGTFQ